MSDRLTSIFKRFLSSCIFVLLMTLSALTHCWASGFVVARFGGEHGHPATSNLSAIYYNPAALTLGSGTRLMIDGTFAHRSVDYTRPEAAVSSPGMGTPTDVLSANAGQAQLRNFAASPFITVASDFGVKRLTVAFGLYVPFGGGASWNQNEGLSAEQQAQYPGIVDGQQRWWSIDSSLKSVYLTLAAAYQVTDQFHFGVAVSRVSTTIDTIRARGLSPGADDLVNEAGGHVEARSYLNATSSDLAVGAGVVYEPTDTIRVGYSYQSQPGFGELRLEGNLTVANPIPGSMSTPTPSNLLMSLPDVHRLGVQFQGKKSTEQDKQEMVWELRVFGDYVRWSLFDRQCLVEEGADCDDNATLNIQKNWQNAFGIRVGGSYWISQMLEVYLGGGYDANAAPDLGVDPSLFDMNKFSAALGARASLLDEQLLLGLTFTQVIYLTREVDVVKDGNDRPYNGYDVLNQSGPSAAGTYAQSVSVANLYAQYQF